METVGISQTDPQTNAEVAVRILRKFGIDGLIGSVDVKRVICSIRDPNCKDYKGQHSIMMLSTSDEGRGIVHYEIGMPGSQHDRTAYNASDFGKAAADGTLMPPGTAREYFLIGDQSFAGCPGTPTGRSGKAP